MKLKNGTILKCDQCDYSSTTSWNLKRHAFMHTGEKPYHCDECSFKCNRASLLKIHLRTHTGEKPFSCTECQSSFNNPGNLKSHMLRHTGEIRFNCNQCNYKTGRANRLKMHMFNHTGEAKPFNCGDCKFSSFWAKDLKRHMFKHSGKEKPFSCSQCSFTTTRSSSLKRHSRKHLDKKPISFTECTYTCREEGSLKRHKFKHTGESKPFICNACSFSCFWAYEVKKHIAAKHPEEIWEQYGASTQIFLWKHIIFWTLSPFRITYSRFDLYHTIWTALDIPPLLSISQCCVLLYFIGEMYFSTYLAKREMPYFLQQRKIVVENYAFRKETGVILY